MLLQGHELLYKIWPGKNRFYLRGRIMVGPAIDQIVQFYNIIQPNTVVWIIILIAPILLLAITWQFSWDVTPVLPISVIVEQILCIYFLWKTQTTEPGIIPRRNIQTTINTDNYLIEGQNSSLCKTCNIHRPQRSSHCRLCDNCVLVYDHHCPFVNNCIGKRNYRYFFSFLICVFTLAFTAFFILLLFATQNNSNSDHSFALVLLIPIGILFVVVFLFFCFHVILRVMSATTRERLKQLSHNFQQDFDWWDLQESLFNPRQVI